MKNLVTLLVLFLAYTSFAQPCEIQLNTNIFSAQEGIDDTLRISCKDFNSIESFQGALEFDPTMFEFIGYKFSDEITSESIFGLTNAVDSILSYLWVGDPRTLPDDSVILEVYLKGLRDDESTCNFDFISFGNISLEVISSTANGFGMPLAVCTGCGDSIVSNTDDIKMESISSSTLELYPNPSGGLLSIQSKKIFKSIDVLTSTGSRIKTMPYAKELNLSFLSSGAYLLEFKRDQERIIKRLIIQ